MRIGIVTGEYPPMQGGVGAFSRVLARTLAEAGEDVFVLTSKRGAGSDDGVTVENQIGGWTPLALAAIERWARARRLAVINLQYQTAAYAMSPWIHVLPDAVRAAPVVTTFHDLRFPYLFPKAGPLRGWIVRHLVSASAGAIATNQEDFAQLSLARRAVLIPIGSNVGGAIQAGYDAAEWRAKAGAMRGEFLIVYFGFLNRSKGVETLLDALASLRQAGVPARLLMVGGRTGASDPTNAAYADEIERKIAALGLDLSVTWTGFVADADVSAYLRAADAVALPFADGASYRRGSLMAALEAGSPLVATTPIAAVPSFEDGVNMLLVPAGNAEALAHALRRLADDPALRQFLREGAAKLAGQFDWRSIARETVAFFRQVIA